jgi:hypothetical protein
LYTQQRYSFLDSLGSGGGAYALSITRIRRYSRVAGMTVMWGGFRAVL